MLLDALNGKNFQRPPVWIMRQAGRALPEYRKVREKYSLRECFLTPELAAEITLLPVDILGVDAAILFADIALIALSLGFTLDFNEGPVIGGTLSPKSVEETLAPVFEAIRLIKQKYQGPLLGFCGAPYTVSTYIGQKIDLDLITDQTIEYLKLQEKAGVDAIQIFDSAGHTLSHEDYCKYSLPYIKRIREAVSVPVILFMRETHKKLNELVSVKPNAISFDWERPLDAMRKEVPCAVQGNLNPDFLFEPMPEIRRQTKALLASMKNDPAFIVNLGHGLKPNTPVDAVRSFVDTVKSA